MQRSAMTDAEQARRDAPIPPDENRTTGAIAVPNPRGGGRPRRVDRAGHAVIGFAKPRFHQTINLFTILGNTTFQGMLSLGMVYLLAIREIDLSVGWMFNFSAVIAALLMVAGLDPWLAMIAGVAFGAVLGLVNGLLVLALRLPSIIVTLGTFSMFQGLALVTNNGRAIVPDPTASCFHLISAKIFGIVPVVAIVFVALAIVLPLDASSLNVPVPCSFHDPAI